MDRYYFLVSQLPTLGFGKKSSMTLTYFLEQAKRWLTNKDLNKLSSIDIYDTFREKIGVKSYQDYQKFEYRFRKGLAEYRDSIRQGKEPKKITFPEELVKEGNPLTIEKNLLQYRWNFIDNLFKGHDFDFDVIVLYYLQLQINAKLSVFDKEKGLEKFHQTVEEKSYQKDNSEIV